MGLNDSTGTYVDWSLRGGSGQDDWSTHSSSTRVCSTILRRWKTWGTSTWSTKYIYYFPSCYDFSFRVFLSPFLYRTTLSVSSSQRITTRRKHKMQHRRKIYDCVQCWFVCCSKDQGRLQQRACEPFLLFFSLCNSPFFFLFSYPLFPLFLIAVRSVSQLRRKSQCAGN